MRMRVLDWLFAAGLIGLAAPTLAQTQNQPEHGSTEQDYREERQEGLQARLAAAGAGLLVRVEIGQGHHRKALATARAALRVQRDEDYLSLDLRVDDHPEPFIELRRLYEKSQERAFPFIECLPGRGRPSGTIERPLIEAHIERFLAQRQKGQP